MSKKNAWRSAILPRWNLHQASPSRLQLPVPLRREGLRKVLRDCARGVLWGGCVVVGQLDGSLGVEDQPHMVLLRKGVQLLGWEW